MNTDWQDYLKGLNANWEHDCLSDFGHPDQELEAALQSPSLIPITEFSLLEISGEDRESFLHGQLITDIKDLSPMQSQYTAWCNPKGQVISNMLIMNIGHSYLLLINTEQKNYLVKRLQMFILRSDVNVIDQSDAMPTLGLANISSLPASLQTEPVLNESDISALDDGYLCCLPGEAQRYIVIANSNRLIELVKHQSDMTLAGAKAWRLLNIQAGIPWVSTDTQEQFLPQMLNMDQFDALSYQKGCYPGQEVIARLHYRGEVKKRVQFIHAKQTLSSGTQLLTADATKAGSVINAESHPDGHYYALAVLDLDKLNQSLFADGDNTNPIGVSSLPYTVED